MDTRTKILTADSPREWKEPVVLVLGTFNVLRRGLLHDLESARAKADQAGARLLAVVLPVQPEYLPQQARAELAAALRMIDYVVTGDREAARKLAETLTCVASVDLDQADAARSRELKELVDGRQS